MNGNWSSGNAGGATSAPESPAIASPRGGGAIRGIDESFQVSPATGTVKLRVGLPVARARGAFAPALSLDYDSGAGNGPFGVGWSVPIPAITRRADNGVPTYGDDDTFLYGGEQLVPLLIQTAGGWRPDAGERPGPGGAAWWVQRYRPRVGDSFARIERWTDRATGESFWRVVSPDNVVTRYGGSPESRIADPADGARVFSWLVCDSHDDRGNAIRFVYQAEDARGVDPSRVEEANRSPGAQRFLKRVLYGNPTPHRPGDDLPARTDWMFETVFDYGDHDPEAPGPTPSRPWPVRADSFSTGRPGFDLRTHRLCRRVLLFHHFPDEPIGSNALVGAVELGYEEDPVLSRLVSARSWGFDAKAAGTPTRLATPPVEFAYSPVTLGETARELDPGGTSGRECRWANLDGDALPGLLAEYPGGWYYKPNLGGARFGPARALPTRPAAAHLAGGRQALLDLDADGRLELVLLADRPAGFSERAAEGGWKPFRPLAHVPNLDWTDDNIRLVDLTGDGRADILVTDENGFTWYPSEGEAGFGPARAVGRGGIDDQRGPVMVFDDASETVFLADMTGDGLPDLVRITRGSVCYRQNLGHARFGPTITMGNAPLLDGPDQFDPARVLLVDADGSGAADLIYLSGEGATLYRNESGNRWSAGLPLDAFPPVEDATKVTVADVLGRGTGCLVWWSTSPAAVEGRSARFLELSTGAKPHLITFVRNNLGAETTFTYTPSTEFDLADRAAGRPWATRLPFPIQCLSKVVHVDRVTGRRFATEYAYHHGCHDGDEREFRGFGLIDQLDAETFEALAASGAANALDPALHQPPVLTRTWRHTGGTPGNPRADAAYRDEYYANAVLPEPPIADPELPPDLPPEELAEALRALRGAVLRQEVFSLDGTPAASHPYVTTSNTFAVSRLQPRGANQRAAFLVTPRETITHQYDRVPADPRASHGFVLETGDHGEVTKSVSVAYPRAIVDPATPPAARASQAIRAITYTEIDHTADLDQPAPSPLFPAHRLRAPFASRSYELTGFEPAEGRRYFQRSDFGDPAALAEVPFESAPPAGPAKAKRLLRRVETRFLKDDLTGPLPRGEHGGLGLVHASYSLAFTPTLVAALYGDRLTADMLAAAGYVHLDGDANWWAPSATATYPPAAIAADHFFLPDGTRDPFGNQSSIQRDKYDLLATRTRDAALNETTATNDYRLLAPTMVTDPNGNRAQVGADPLGRVTWTALLGSEATPSGDSADEPTTRFEYDHDAWTTRGEPATARAFAREQHGPGNPRWREQHVYTSGFGDIALVKTRAEPGKAWRRNPATNAIEEIDTTPEPRWIGTGRTIVNNKGNPVRRFEPYFSADPGFDREPELVQRGQSVTVFYDPIGRPIRVDHPDGTFSRVEIGAWRSRAFDRNDTVLESQWYADRGAPDPTAAEPADPATRAAWVAAKHANTPTVTYADSLGRIVCSIADNGPAGAYASRTETDLTGRLSLVFDNRDREVARAETNMLGATCRSLSAERGEQWLLADALGAMAWSGDDRGRTAWTQFDALRRVERVYVDDGIAGPKLASLLQYGEGHPDAAARNLRGKPHRVFDQAGAITFERFDFKGGLVETHRRLAKQYKGLVDWTPLVAPPEDVDIPTVTAKAEPLLEPAVDAFRATIATDALGRPTEVVLPDGTIVRSEFNETDHVETLSARLRGVGAFVPFVTTTDHDAKGQRLSLSRGNGTVTTYEYEPDTFRAKRARTTRAADSATLLDLSYVYDPVGNVCGGADAARAIVFHAGEQVRPEWRYEYDAIYRLTRATGRELAGPVAPPNHVDQAATITPHPNDVQAVRNYVEEYEYDDLGNLKRTRHVAAGGSWTRRHQHAYETNPADRTNRLTATSEPGDADGVFSSTYTYDPSGGMRKMPHMAGDFVWNLFDQLAEADLGGGGRAFYVYAAGGQRVRQVIERPGGQRIDRITLGAVELRREYGAGGLKLERWTTRIGEPGGEIARVETTTIDVSTPGLAITPITRHQYHNHLGSAVLEADADGAVISYEEYHPFGSTAYRAGRSAAEVSLKPYRFGNKERDDETGLYYFGARYYAPWLGRWISPDPAGFVDGLNLFAFARNNPVTFADPTGTQSAPERITDPEITGNETWQQLQDIARRRGFVIDDPGVNETNYRSRLSPATKTHPANWNINIRRLTPTELQAALNPEPPPQAPSGTNFPREAAAGRRDFRNNTTMPAGTQAQHWTKERSAQAANIHPDVMNENMSPLQSRNRLPATTLLTDPKGGGTRYSIPTTGQTFGNEHKFADRFLIIEEESRLRAANPTVNRGAAAIEAGRMARWRMEGVPGPAPGNGRGYGVAVPLSEVMDHLPPEGAEPSLPSPGPGIGARLTSAGPTLARGLIPGFAEAELIALTAEPTAIYLGVNTGMVAEVTAAMAAAPATAAAVMVTSAVGGYFVGGTVGRAVTEATGSEVAGGGAGVIAGAATGAAIGAGIGAIFGGIGAGPGAIIGGIVGGIAGFIGTFW